MPGVTFRWVASSRRAEDECVARFFGMSITIVGNFWVSARQALFEVGQRDAARLRRRAHAAE